MPEQMWQNQLPHSQVFPNTWTWTKTPENIVILNLVAPQAIVPILVFTKAEGLKDFIDSTLKAWEEFIPKAVRDGVGIVQEYNKGVELDEQIEPHN